LKNLQFFEKNKFLLTDSDSGHTDIDIVEATAGYSTEYPGGY